MKNIIDYYHRNILYNHLNFPIKELSIFICSEDNLNKRKKNEINIILDNIQNFINYYFNSIKNNEYNFNIKINIEGNLNLLPNDIKNKLLLIMQDSSKNEYILNLAIGYHYINDLQKIFNNFNKDFNNKNLLPKNQIDLVIRTGGDIRTSGFFPLHTIYSEWFFIEKYWPEFTIEDLNIIIMEFNKRIRRFGK
jgi:undecaprenyl diphosphate synthase